MYYGAVSQHYKTRDGGGGGGKHVYDSARGRPSVGLVIKRRPGEPRVLCTAAF